MNEAIRPPVAVRRPRGEAGDTLIESMVALVLLVTVLAPAAAFVHGLAVQRHNAARMTALVLAQHHLEAALHDRRYTPAVVPVDGGAWRVERNVEEAGRHVILTVRVFRGHDAEPSAELTTLRLR